MALTPKQRLFVKEYLVDLSATQAAVRAGYSARTAHSAGPRLLAHVGVRTAIDAALADRATKVEVTAEEVLRELKRIAFAGPRRVMTWGPGGVKLRDSEKLSEDDAAIVAEVSETTSDSGGSLKLKTHDKVKALELLGKHLGMFTDKVEHSGVMSIAVVDPYAKGPDRG